MLLCCLGLSASPICCTVEQACGTPQKGCQFSPLLINFLDWGRSYFACLNQTRKCFSYILVACSCAINSSLYIVSLPSLCNCTVKACSNVMNYISLLSCMRLSFLVMNWPILHLTCSRSSNQVIFLYFTVTLHCNYSILLSFIPVTYFWSVFKLQWPDLVWRTYVLASPCHGSAFYRYLLFSKCNMIHAPLFVP